MRSVIKKALGKAGLHLGRLESITSERRENELRLIAATKQLEEAKVREATNETIIKALQSEVNDLKSKADAAAALDLRGITESQLVPLALPLPPEGFFIKVKIDYPDVLKPRPATYVYPSVERLLLDNVHAMEANASLLRPYMYHEKLDRLASAKPNEVDPYWNNGMFDFDDARLAYAMAAFLKPKRIIEVGSGNSTKFFRRAISDWNLDTRLISIDPMPRAEIKDVADEIIYKSIIDVDVELFAELGQNDILFWDGSHIVFNGSDSTQFYLNILPVVKSGVYVHVHDMCLPNEYNWGYSAHYYNEQYMLATLLLNSQSWLPVFAAHFLKPRLLVRNPGACSFWMGHRHLTELSSLG